MQPVPSVISFSEMDYAQTLEWLFTQTSVFQRDGAAAYKPGLETITQLSEAFGAPHRRLRCIHVAGTNGKGSTASTLAAIFQSAGLKTALYTSPHLVDFRERMRIDGQMISRDRVVDFVRRYQSADLGLQPSFFELTTAMAFEWFADEKVDIAIIEVGLGGRLDSTNIITPLVSVITNISPDHTSLLGSTVAEIAREKAGIIKQGIPVVIGEAADGDVRRVFEETAGRNGSELRYASTLKAVKSPAGGWDYPSEDLHGELDGEFQPKNMATVLEVMKFFPEIPHSAIAAGMASVTELTGLRGRMTRTLLPDGRTLIYDTGHNPGAWHYLGKELSAIPDLTMIVGFAADKDVRAILHLLPRNADYIFTRPEGNRGLDPEILRQMALEAGLDGRVADSVPAALALPSTQTLFVGGSNFIVAQLPL